MDRNAILLENRTEDRSAMVGEAALVLSRECGNFPVDESIPALLANG
jgi:uncharacterized protein YbaR (Trm112 family)